MKAFSSDKNFKWYFGLWWLFWVCIQTYLLNNYGIAGFHSFVDALVSNMLLAGFCFLMSNNMRYYLPRQEKYWYVLFISIAMSAFWLVVLRIILWVLFKSDSNYISAVEKSSAIRFAFGFLMIACMATISLLWYTQQEQKQANARNADAERLSKEAELNKLRQQLQPHFLFNSLNSISALTGSQPEKARHMIEQLSEFLRGTLRKDEQQWNTLKEEIQYLELYLEIEKVRFGHRLITKIECSDESLNCKLPALILQPVVENAIKFGLYDTTGEVNISIFAEKQNNYLQVTVKNPFDEDTAQPFHGTGFGLASIKRRLFLLFARHDLLETKNENNFFTTVIIIPQ